MQYLNDTQLAAIERLRIHKNELFEILDFESEPSPHLNGGNPVCL